MREWEFFKFVRVRIEKQVSEVRKKFKTLLCFDLFYNFRFRVADIKVAVLSPILVIFSVMKMLYFDSIDAIFFLRGDIH